MSPFHSIVQRAAKVDRHRHCMMSHQCPIYTDKGNGGLTLSVSSNLFQTMTSKVDHHRLWRSSSCFLLNTFIHIDFVCQFNSSHAYKVDRHRLCRSSRFHPFRKNRSPSTSRHSIH